MKWGIPSEPAWAYLQRSHPDLIANGEEAFRIASAYDAGKNSVVDALRGGEGRALFDEKVAEVQLMADAAAIRLGGPVQVLSSEYDPALHRITFTWERR